MTQPLNFEAAVLAHQMVMLCPGLRGTQDQMAECRAILQALGKHGVTAIEQAVSCGRGPSGRKLRLLTHCNTGSLATAAYGTALGVVRALAEAGRLEHAFCTETRPYNQGEPCSGGNPCPRNQSPLHCLAVCRPAGQQPLHLEVRINLATACPDQHQACYLRSPGHILLHSVQSSSVPTPQADTP